MSQTYRMVCEDGSSIIIGSIQDAVEFARSYSYDSIDAFNNDDVNFMRLEPIEDGGYNPPKNYGINKHGQAYVQEWNGETWRTYHP